MSSPTAEEITKFKRQLRDYYNKHVNDLAILKKMAEAINYPYPIKESTPCQQK